MNQRVPADRETVLLVPDHHTSSFAFSAAAKAMRGSGTNVVTFDFPGFGLSDPPSAADEAADPDAAAIKTLKSVVTMLKLRTFHLVLQVQCNLDMTHHTVPLAVCRVTYCIKPPTAVPHRKHQPSLCPSAVLVKLTTTATITSSCRVQAN